MWKCFDFSDLFCKTDSAIPDQIECLSMDDCYGWMDVLCEKSIKLVLYTMFKYKSWYRVSCWICTSRFCINSYAAVLSSSPALSQSIFWSCCLWTLTMSTYSLSTCTTASLEYCLYSLSWRQQDFKMSFFGQDIHCWLIKAPFILLWKNIELWWLSSTPFTHFSLLFKTHAWYLISPRNSSWPSRTNLHESEICIYSRSRSENEKLLWMRRGWESREIEACEWEKIVWSGR